MRSLRSVLFLWLLGPLISLWLFGSIVAVAIIRDVTEGHYDEELLDAASAINVLVDVEDRRLTVRMTEADQRALLYNPVDEEAFAVIDDAGAVMAGAPDLPRPRQWEAIEKPTYYDAPYRGHDMRWIALSMRHALGDADSGNADAHIIFGETRRRRESATRDAIVHIAMPQLLAALGLAALIWFGIGRGLEPLGRLQRRLKERTAADLDPIAIGKTPEEIRAVVDELNSLLDRLNSSLKQQSAFIGDAAHQLRTPLAALKASIEYVNRRRDTPDPRSSLDGLAETVDRCIRVVNQLLALAQADVAQTGGVEMQKVDVIALCEETVAASVDAALARDIDLGLDAESSRLTVRADPTLLREALRNLIDNAIRYTPRGGRVTVSVQAHGDRLRIAVTDSGPGISPSDRERIFERFQRGESATGTGSGLGLPIARLCARALGGDAVYFDPANDEGAGFAIELPLAA